MINCGKDDCSMGNDLLSVKIKDVGNDEYEEVYLINGSTPKQSWQFHKIIIDVKDGEKNV